MGFIFLHNYVWLCTALFGPLVYPILYPILFLHYSDTRDSAMKRTALDNIKQIKDTHLLNLEPEDKEYRISCDAGLYFRVSPKGKKLGKSVSRMRLGSGSGIVLEDIRSYRL